MARQPIYGDKWSESSLERARRIGEEVYLRALSRQVSWPPVRQKFCPQEVECAEVPFDKAFSSMMHHLRSASKECWKYHANHEHVRGFRDSEDHCKRFHRVPQPAPFVYKGNLFQKEDTIQITLPPGGYSVTAHQPRTGAKQTNIVQVNDKGCVTLDFNL